MNEQLVYIYEQLGRRRSWWRLLGYRPSYIINSEKPEVCCLTDRGEVWARRVLSNRKGRKCSLVVQLTSLIKSE
jgi:hypothetical protein